MQRPLVIAHRGTPAEAPENTMAGFRRALDLGTDGLEFDVHLSRDGEPVVCHDEQLDRTTNGHGFLKDYTLEELRRLDAGSWFDPGFKGERLPTAREVLALAADRGAFVNVELKSGIVLYPGLEAKVAALLAEFGLTGRAIVSSFNHYSLVALMRLAPQIKTGLLYEAGLYEPWVYARHVGAGALHPYFPGVFPELVAGAHAAGLLVNPWTVDEPEHLRAMIAAGVDGIITNRPERLIELLGAARH